MKKELRVFLTAVEFYTRIPCPARVNHSEQYLTESRKFFPVIGWIVGGLSALVLYTAQSLFPMHIAILLTLIAGILLTGAFHEDGFADVCDAFGGGFTREKILEILKDSRIGAYGAIGITLLLALKYAVLLEISKIDLSTLLLVLIASHSLSRFVALTLIYTHHYVRDDDTAKSRPVVARRSSLSEMVFSFVTGMLPLLFFKTWWVFMLIVPVYLAKAFLASYFKKWIGGYTGDCLGATQQLCEVLFYSSFLLLWKYLYPQLL